jgi:pimeloyl-ACP methyl ester carboxylesterase
MKSEKKTWIFLRGLTRQKGHWGDFLDQFQLTFPHSKVIALDMAGNGNLNQQISPWTVQDMVAHCRSQLALRKIAPPYHVLAMSLGAMVAVEWARAYPQEIAANVLINTSMRPFSPFYRRLRPANYAALLKLIFLGAQPIAWERTILQITSNGARDDVLPQWLALRERNPVSGANALRQLVAAARFHALPAPPLGPTLILASKKDRLVSVECSKSLASQWQCPLRLHASAGHDLPLDDGPWVATQVRDWMRGGTYLKKAI